MVQTKIHLNNTASGFPASLSNFWVRVPPFQYDIGHETSGSEAFWADVGLKEKTIDLINEAEPHLEAFIRCQPPSNIDGDSSLLDRFLDERVGRLFHGIETFLNYTPSFTRIITRSRS